MRTRSLAAAILLPALLVSVLVIAEPASAEQSTTVTFPNPASLSIDFGDEWVVPISVTTRAAYEGYSGSQTTVPLAANDGTIDVLMDGSPGTWARGLPLNPGGVAYLSQPAAAATLGTGTHVLTAVYQPAAGSGYQTSKTAQTFTITVKGYDLAVHSQIVDDPTVVAEPTLRLSLDGSWVDKHDGKVPEGTWAITVTDTATSKVVLRRGLLQKAAELTDPISIPFGYRTDPGHRYRIGVVFAPAIWLTPGITVTQAKDQGYATTAPPPLAFLLNPVGMPLWAGIAIGAAALLLLIAAVLLTVLAFRARRRIGRLESGDESPAVVPVAVGADDVPADTAPPARDPSTGY